MTEQEAIEKIKYDHCDSCKGRWEGCGSCLYKLAIDALEKQIPKKPKRVRAKFDYDSICECGRVITINEKYCDRCGTAIDWSDSND